MGSVEFNDEGGAGKPSLLYSKFQASNQSPRMVAWLKERGLVKDDSQANGILLGVAITAFVLMLVVIFAFVL